MSVYSNRFKEKVAIVTGGASGIGFSIAERLIKEGAKVVAADINKEQLAKMQDEFGSAFIGKETDVTNESEVEKLVAETLKQFGSLNYAFNVAGMNRPGQILDLTEEDWNFTVNLCLKGVFLSIKHEARAMKNHGGAIINVSSLNAHVPMFAGSAYSSAKAGVEMLTKNAALELARYNIRVNAILPGLVDTPLTGRLVENQEIKNAFLERIPLGRVGKPSDIAGPALFLASDDANYISGASLLVDGAWAVSGYPDMSRWLS